MKKTVLSLLAGAFLAGCDTGLHTMKATEYGIKFRNLPTFLGGGIASDVLPPGQTGVVFPWEAIYTLTTSVREVSWGPGKMFPELLNTRARDGNEVALAVTVRYELSTKPEDLVNIAQYVATTDDGIAGVVTTVARADIRNVMNQLKTTEFIDPEARGRAIDRVKAAMQKRLDDHSYRITVLNVTLDDFRFERLLPNNVKDDTYQDKLDEIQRVNQETEREKAREDTVKALKEGRYNEVQAEVNRVVAEAKGYKEQSRKRSDNYVTVRTNEAKAILTSGSAEVEGTIAQINALAGPGGNAMLRLDIAKTLLSSNAQFVVMNEGDGGSGIAVNRTDMNELLRQVGIVESLRRDDAAQVPATPTPSPQPTPQQESAPQ